MLISQYRKVAGQATRNNEFFDQHQLGDQSQYSKLEKDKTDPSVSTLAKVAKALGAQLSELFANDLLRGVNSYDKSVMEKISLIDSLDEDEKKSLFKIIDGLSSKKKMKDSLAKALAQ